MNIYLKFSVACLFMWIMSKTRIQITTSATPCAPVPATLSTAPQPFPPTSPSPSSPPPLPPCPEELDAQAIVDSQMKEEIVAGILPYRTRYQCITINTMITEKNGGKYFITDDYIYTPVPEGTNPLFKDLCFGLVKDKAVVLSGYLNIFFERKDETWIIIILVLTKNMDNLKTTYDIYHEGNFKHMIKKQRHPFQNMLNKWCAQSREPDEAGDLNQDNIRKDADALKREENVGHWSEDRNQIETILVKKSMKYAKAVIEEYEKSNGGGLIEDIINKNKDTWLNSDLVDAYSSLARYIKDKYKYIADIMRQYSDGSDRWAVWIMCIAVVDPSEWAQVNLALQKDHPGESLSALVMKENTQDKVMAEMMAVIVDPTFEPTTFTPKISPGTALPPVQPTTLAPPSPYSTSTPVKPPPSVAPPPACTGTPVSALSPPPAPPTTVAPSPPPAAST